MALQTQDFVTLVKNQAASIQGAASKLIDFTVGSVLRAIVEANAGVVLWLQGLILQLLATTRAATCSGSDLDSFYADFNHFRIAATSAIGRVTFGRYTATLQSIVPVGAQVQTGDGSQTYTVIADTANANYTAGVGYVLAAGISNLSVTVQAAVPAAANNVVIGSINTIVQPISGIDYCMNAAAFVNGADAELDAAFRTRFIAYIASLSKGTEGAVQYAISSIQTGLSSTFVENVNYAGTAQPGYFYVVVDDGTGTPSGTLLSTVGNVIDTVRSLTSTFGVFSPVVVTANVALTISTAAGYTHSAVVALVQTSITTYINSLPLGTSLSYTRLQQIAYDTSPGITNVTAITLNAGTSDLTAMAQQVIKAGTVVIS